MTDKEAVELVKPLLAAVTDWFKSMAELRRAEVRAINIECEIRKNAKQ